MWTPGIWELMIILVIVLAIFGGAKLKNLGRDLGGAISEFKDSVNKKDEDTDGNGAAGAPHNSDEAK